MHPPDDPRHQATPRVGRRRDSEARAFLRDANRARYRDRFARRARWKPISEGGAPSSDALRASARRLLATPTVPFIPAAPRRVAFHGGTRPARVVAAEPPHRVRRRGDDRARALVPDADRARHRNRFARRARFGAAARNAFRRGNPRKFIFPVILRIQGVAAEWKPISEGGAPILGRLAGGRAPPPRKADSPLHSRRALPLRVSRRDPPRARSRRRRRPAQAGWTRAW
jgi:hypothetical protein